MPDSTLNLAGLAPETAELAVSLERGLQQAQRGEYAAVHTPEAILARRKQAVLSAIPACEHAPQDQAGKRAGRSS